MGKLYILRHGQADSLGANYDQLTPLGFLQAQRFGEYILRMDWEIDFFACGSLQRQTQTMESIVSTIKLKKNYSNKENSISYKIMNELNEFDGALWKKMAEKVAKEDKEFYDTMVEYRQLKSQSHPNVRSYFQKIIQRILKEWLHGLHDDIHSFDTYHDTVISSLDQIPKNSKNILFVTSATPIAIFAGYSLGLEKKKYLSFMDFICNTSLSIYEWEAGQLQLVTFNSFPHILCSEEFTYL